MENYNTKKLSGKNTDNEYDIYNFDNRLVHYNIISNSIQLFLPHENVLCL